MEIDNTRIQENNFEVLQISLRIIDEHLSREKERGNSADKRATTIITFIGILATVILAFTKLVIINNNSLIICVSGFLVITLIFLIKSIINIMNLFQVKQIDTLSPDMINDIQDKTKNQAIAYEVKWKIWEYNKLTPYNSKKLFYLNRAQRNTISCIFSILILALALFADDYIKISECWFLALQLIIVILAFIFALISDTIMEINGIWKK